MFLPGCFDFQSLKDKVTHSHTLAVTELRKPHHQPLNTPNTLCSLRPFIPQAGETLNAPIASSTAGPG